MHHALALALLLLAAPAGGATIVLDFEEEEPGIREWGYVSLECGCVSFAYGPRADEDEWAAVRDYGFPTGHAYSFSSDQADPLTLNFLSLVDALSLDFQAGATDNSNRPEPWDGRILPGSQAVLAVFLGAARLGEARVTLDLVNGGMDQSIGISGVGAFDRAVLRYEAALSPTIDNLVFNTVPEPGTLELGFVCALLLGSRVVRRLPRRHAIVP